MARRILSDRVAKAESLGVVWVAPPDLERQRLMSSVVRAVLERHQVTTSLERVEVLDRACSRGELSASECQAIGRGRRRRWRDD